MSKLIPTIGIEVHCELKTKHKVFSNSLNTYGYAPNTMVNEIDLGYPGTLPTLNKEVVDLGIKAALVLNCKINKEMYFDRKNYFYPDNPKNFQITQKSTPIGYDGYVEIECDGKIKKIGIEEMHIEEDTCKSFHEEGKTLLDFNRAGIPLIEIVTKPVIESNKEAVLYVEKLREILLYAGISDVKIEEGSMRCDVNVSMRENDTDVLGTKVEIKNIGSISNVSSGILYEMKRQSELIENNIKIVEETRKYDEKSGTTILMRVKETGNDYRYFPEPNIPKIRVSDEEINNIKMTIPLLPDELRKQYKDLDINDIAINALIGNRALNKFLNDLIDLGANPIVSANIITGDVLAYLNKHSISIEDTKLNVPTFKTLIDMVYSNEISSKIAKEILSEMFISNNSVEEIINLKGLKQINDEDEIKSVVDGVLRDYPDAISEYNNGNVNIAKFLMGQIMKRTSGQANPELSNKILGEKLNRK